MTKRILFGVLAIGLLISCNNQNNSEATAIETAEFATIASNLLDQTVSIEGTVLHVCKHGGKKMFINEDRVKVIASEKLAAFEQTLEGSTVIVKGIVREEMVPVLTESAEPAETEEAVENEDIDNTAKVDCDMEEEKPLYVIEVIEVIEVTEKIQ